jgi:hypothetical protein
MSLLGVFGSRQAYETSLARNLSAAEHALMQCIESLSVPPVHMVYAASWQYRLWVDPRDRDSGPCGGRPKPASLTRRREEAVCEFS